jgi:hypothetical protein
MGDNGESPHVKWVDVSMLVSIAHLAVPPLFDHYTREHPKSECNTLDPKTRVEETSLSTSNMADLQFIPAFPARILVLAVVFFRIDKLLFV